MSRRSSELSERRRFLDGSDFRSAEALHGALAAALGLPSWYGRNWDALLDCLSSLGDPAGDSCARRAGEDVRSSLVLAVRNFSAEQVRGETLLAFLQVVADANERLAASDSPARVRLEFTAGADAHPGPARVT